MCWLTEHFLSIPESGNVSKLTYILCIFVTLSLGLLSVCWLTEHFLSVPESSSVSWLTVDVQLVD